MPTASLHPAEEEGVEQWPCTATSLLQGLLLPYQGHAYFPTTPKDFQLLPSHK